MIKDLKDVAALLKLCRKNGVSEIDVGAWKIKFGDMPSKQILQETADDVPTDELTPEQLMLYSVRAMGDE